MPGFFLALLLTLPIAGLAIRRAIRLSGRLGAAEAAAGAARRQAEGRGRGLALLAREIQGPGLALLAEAPALPEAPGRAIAAVGQHLLRLSDDIADYLAADAGPRRLAPEALALAPLLEEAVAQVIAQLGAGGRAWRLAEGFAGLTLQADRRALLGALVQVLARAARMTREGDAIDLRPVVTGDAVSILVEDEGAGLPAADLAAGAPDGEAPGTRGLGFGLAIARALVEAHGGSLRLEALPGIGARAWLTLPRERLVGG
ncbi:sensor histidine kinase [Paracraurococcus lichenis]|uniref:histidine kinase n=1 Tax=Paracraurococcus lichenis TaxID=3064888 RepID=A0ABT9E4G1_9PROT|nr:ATP-binding protein [Paracraurococcus sp. LOR1-02]MDO9711062.1 ATP-binding protein [Paracraurococcus sp. LOR1-02]